LEPKPPDEDAVRPASSQVAGKILLVEDDAVLSDLYRVALEGAGWSVEVVHDERSALDRALESPPDVLLVNTIPDRRDLLGRIRSHPPTRDLPVILMNNSGDEPETELVEELGVLAVLVKSRAIRDDLSTTVRDLLENQRRSSGQSS
jgi:two-component system response regulator VicR